MVEVAPRYCFALQNDLTNQKRHDIIVTWGVTNAHLQMWEPLSSQPVQLGPVVLKENWWSF